MAGFEGADHRDAAGRPLDYACSTGHLDRLDDDYANLARLGVTEVRESVRWRLCEPRPGVYRFDRVRRQLQAARRHGLTIAWTVLHYGAPDGLSFESARFVPRFEAFCRALAHEIGAAAGSGARYTPVNEISFLAYAVSETNIVFPWQPVPGKVEAMHFGYRMKCVLAQACVAAIHAIREVDRSARIMSVEPLVHVVAPVDRPDLIGHANATRQCQWQASDMLVGRIEPRLGGAPELIDTIGVNHYYNSQWEVDNLRPLEWELTDRRRVSLHALLAEAWGRYRKPLVIAETGHVGHGRAAWMNSVARQTLAALDAGVPVEGMCLYPAVDRTDWNDPGHWHNSGIWDLPLLGERRQPRLHAPYARSIRRWQRRYLARGFQAPPDLPSSSKLPAVSPRPLLRPLMNGTEMHTLIVFSHLRWNFVFQRPQHLLSRLSQDRRVLFIEEPLPAQGPASFESCDISPTLRTLRPHTPAQAPGFHDEQVAHLQPLLEAYLDRHGIVDYDVWFYTPMALPLLSGLRPRAVIYDCMDELSAFKGAPLQMTQREGALLKRADLVLTGGPSLYEHKRHSNPNVHCFPSAVDRAHFASAAPARATGTEHTAIEPVLGFFGVIDERLDIGLIGALACAHPDWRIEMVGPVVKIDPAALPRHPNLHWLGQHDYHALPALISGWDVCLVPFAINAATRFISPTKTLEYMAAGRPVVSTPIKDVVDLYGDAVWIAPTASDFIRACEAALTEGTDRRQAREARVRHHLEWNSWDATARAISAELDRLGPARQVPVGVAGAPAPAQTGASVPALVERRTGQPERHARTLILGAGPTGLSAALHLGEDAITLERESRVGGWCRSIEDGGFTFDYAGHIMFSSDPFVLDLYTKLLGDNVHWQNREAWIYSKQVYTRYPFQGSLYGLPPKVLAECLVGAIDARIAAVERKAQAAGEPGAPAHVPRNFEQFIHEVWGAGIAEHFALPYNRKLWAVPLAEMETSWLGGRVPMPDLRQMVEGALEPSAPPMGPNARFGYPLRGGFQALMDAFLPHLTGALHLGAHVVQVIPSQRRVRLADGRTFSYDTLISTMPLPALVLACGDEAPPEVRRAVQGLRHVSVRCVNFGVGRENLTDKHWIYYPEDTVFHRIFVQGNASPHCNAPGGFGITCEITYNDDKPLPCDDAGLIAKAWRDCVRVGIVREDDPCWVANQVDMPYAYVVYDHARAANVACIRKWCDSHGIILSGRYSEWEYYNSDHAFIAGRKAAEQAQAWTDEPAVRERVVRQRGAARNV